MACKHRGGRSKQTYEQKIGTEYVKYTDIICNNCGMTIDRVIVGRRPA